MVTEVSPQGLLFSPKGIAWIWRRLKEPFDGALFLRSRLAWQRRAARSRVGPVAAVSGTKRLMEPEGILALAAVVSGYLQGDNYRSLDNAPLSKRCMLGTVSFTSTY